MENLMFCPGQLMIWPMSRFFSCFWRQMLSNWNCSSTLRTSPLPTIFVRRVENFNPLQDIHLLDQLTDSKLFNLGNEISHLYLLYCHGIWKSISFDFGFWYNLSESEELLFIFLGWKVQCLNYTYTHYNINLCR